MASFLQCMMVYIPEEVRHPHDGQVFAVHAGIHT